MTVLTISPGRPRSPQVLQKILQRTPRHPIGNAHNLHLPNRNTFTQQPHSEPIPNLRFTTHRNGRRAHRFAARYLRARISAPRFVSHSGTCAMSARSSGMRLWRQ